MESKNKLAFSEQLLSPRRRVVSGFNLVIGASLIVVTLLLFNCSWRSPLLLTHNVGTDSSPPPSLSWLLSFSIANVGNGNSSEYVKTKLVQYPSVNNSDCSSNGTSSEAKTSAHEKNVEDRFGVARVNVNYNASSDVRMNGVSKNDIAVNNNNNNKKKKKKKSSIGGMVVLNYSDVNGGVVTSDITRTSEKGKIMVSSSDVNGGVILSGIGNSSLERKFMLNSSDVNGGVLFNGNAEERRPLVNLSSDKGILTRGSYVDDSHDNCDCDMFDGRWVRDDSKPYYPAGSCPFIDKAFNCHLNGRPDDEFVKWRWQPNGCDIPRLNATDFLMRLRGKRLVFVGDSLNRNMWESLVCILRHSVRKKKRVHEVSGRREFKKKGFYAFRFEDYNCSVDFVSAPFLVRESSIRRRNASFETLRLDLMDHTTPMYQDAEVIVFNTGHWWTHEKTSKGDNYYQEGNYVHPRLKVLEAYKRALKTWANWIDRNIDSNHTRVFFRGYSVTHFRGGLWNSGGQCHKEAELIFNETYLAKYPSKMRVLEQVLQEMKMPVTYLNISRLTSYRKDGHPSIYRTIYMSEKERRVAERSQDCSHWCLPGVPDTWNELLYASLLKSGWAHGKIK